MMQVSHMRNAIEQLYEEASAQDEDGDIMISLLLEHFQEFQMDTSRIRTLMCDECEILKYEAGEACFKLIGYPHSKSRAPLLCLDPPPAGTMKKHVKNLKEFIEELE